MRQARDSLPSLRGLPRSRPWRSRFLLCTAVVVAAAAGSVSCSLLVRQHPWDLPPPATRDAPVVQPGALTRSTLSNGVRVIALEDRRLPRVALGVTLRRGAGSVALERAGLASFATALMAQGAGEMDALALALAVDEIGASISVNAGWDATSVTLSGLSRDLDRLVEILVAVVREPVFDEGEAGRVRARQLAGLRQAQDSPGTIASWQAARALYPDHRYGLPMSGTLKSVERLDAPAARAYYQRIFRPENAIVFASGDIDAADWARRSERAFGDWESRGEDASETPAPPDPAPSIRRIVVVDKPELGQARIVVTHGGIARNSERRLAAGLVNNVLGGSGFSSRLMKRIRSDEGLTYGVASHFSMRRQPGPFSVSTFTRVPEARRVVDLILEGIQGIRDNPPSELELATTKSYAVGRFGLNLETSASVLASIVSLDVYGLPEDALDTYRARIRAIDLDDTAAVARDLFHPTRCVIVVLGPAKDLVPQLEGLGDVSVITP